MPSGNDPYYLTGTFKALDSAGKWYRDPSTGKLYLWTPGSDDPSNHDVEVKARDYAFDLSGNSYITIRGVNIFAATIKTDQNSAHVTIDGINAQYTSQYVTLVRGWAVPSNSGIMLNGVDDLLENSTIAYSAGDGVYVKGAGSRVTNNIIHDVDLDAGDSAGIRDYAPNSTLDHNTIYNAGRDGILHETTGVQILYNTIHDVGLQTTDFGGIYTVRTNGGGTVIAYNDVYSLHSGGYGATALYLDNNSSNYVVHNNLTWNVDTALKINFTSVNEKIYNNTLGATQYSVFGNFAGDWTGTTFNNNVFLNTAKFGNAATVTNNVSAATAGYGGWNIYQRSEPRQHHGWIERGWVGFIGRWIERFRIGRIFRNWIDRLEFKWFGYIRNRLFRFQRIGINRKRIDGNGFVGNRVVGDRVVRRRIKWLRLNRFRIGFDRKLRRRGF